MVYNLRSRAERLRKVAADYGGALERLARDGTLRAVEKAAELTPPTGDDLAGTNTRTGELKQHWADDSQIQPQRRGREIVTALVNNMKYASYVNDGHRMDRHFVPGLYVNPGSGLLEHNPDKKGGLVVGTKTTYVEGLHITDQAEKVYKATIRKEIDRLVKEAEK